MMAGYLMGVAICYIFVGTLLLSNVPLSDISPS